MDNRPNLQTVFEKLLGSRNVYFQPPASVQMKYPAIVYSRKTFKQKFANDRVYIQKPCYEVILIDKNPDSKFVEMILQLQYCSFDRHYEKDNLNHDVFTLYY